MRKLSTAIFPLALMALLAALTFWLERAANPDDPARKALKRHDPDYIIEQIDIRHFDSAGAMKQALLAKTMTHFPDDDSTQIAEPHLTYYSGQKTTQLLANSALLSQNNKKVFLHGDVRVIRPPQQGSAATVLRTEALTVFPDDDIASGNVRTTITQGDNVISGDNIHYDGKSNVSTLNGRVKGIFYRVKKS